MKNGPPLIIGDVMVDQLLDLGAAAFFRGMSRGILLLDLLGGGVADQMPKVSRRKPRVVQRRAIFFPLGGASSSFSSCPKGSKCSVQPNSPSPCGREGRPLAMARIKSARLTMPLPPLAHDRNALDLQRGEKLADLGHVGFLADRHDRGRHEIAGGAPWVLDGRQELLV